MVRNGGGFPHRFRPSVISNVKLKPSDDVMLNHFDTRIIISLEGKLAREDLQRWIEILADRLGCGITWERSISNAFHLLHIKGREAEQRAASLVKQSPICAGEVYAAISRYSAEVDSNLRGLRRLVRVSFTAANAWSDGELRTVLQGVGLSVNSRRVRAGDHWMYSALVQTELNYLVTELHVDGTLKLPLHYEGFQVCCDNCLFLDHAYYNCPLLSIQPLSHLAAPGSSFAPHATPLNSSSHDLVPPGFLAYDFQDLTDDTEDMEVEY